MCVFVGCWFNSSKKCISVTKSNTTSQANVTLLLGSFVFFFSRSLFFFILLFKRYSGRRSIILHKFSCNFPLQLLYAPLVHTCILVSYDVAFKVNHSLLFPFSIIHFLIFFAMRTIFEVSFFFFILSSLLLLLCATIV